MKPQKNRPQSAIPAIVSEYEQMAKNGDITIFDPDAFEALIAHYEKENLPAKLSEVIQLAVERFPYQANFHLSHASHLLAIGAYPQAKNALAQAEVLAPDNWEVNFRKAEILVVDRKADEALDLLHAIIHEQSEANLAMVYLLQGIIYQEKQDFKNMFVSLKKSLQDDPTNEHSLHLFWLAVEITRQHEESIVMHKWILDEDPYSALAWSNLGHAYSCLNQWKQAAEAFEYAFIIDKDFEFAYRDCATAHMNYGNYVKALDCLSEGTHCMERDEDLLSQLGLCHLELENFEAARVNLLDALSINPASAEVHFQLGRMKMMQEEWESALLYLKRAAEIDVDEAEYLVCIAKIYQALADFPAALSYYREACQVDHHNLEIQFEYISFLKDAFSEKQALDYLTDIREDFPGQKIDYYSIGLLLNTNAREAGLFKLSEVLRQNFGEHKVLLDKFPELAQDIDVQSLIKSFSPIDL